MSLDAVGIISKNIKASIRFYKLLGCDFKEFSPDHYEAETSSGVRIMLDSVDLIKKIHPNQKNKSIEEAYGTVLCFKLDNPKKLDELYEVIINSGFKSVKKPWDAFWGQRYASVSDPDGHQVDLFAELEKNTDSI